MPYIGKEEPLQRWPSSQAAKSLLIHLLPLADHWRSVNRSV